jgi:hypothetical protein
MPVMPAAATVPAARGSGPPLAAQMTFLQNRLNQQGLVNFAAYVHDNVSGREWVVRQSTQVSNVRADPASCRLAFHWKSTSADGKGTASGVVTHELDTWIALSTLERVRVIPMEEAWKRADSLEGNTTLTYKSDPEVFVVHVGRSDGGYNELHFYDEDAADRIARAVIRAAELCGSQDISSNLPPKLGDHDPAPPPGRR